MKPVMPTVTSCVPVHVKEERYSEVSGLLVVQLIASGEVTMVPRSLAATSCVPVQIIL